jgi:hypothetical protein
MIQSGFSVSAHRSISGFCSYTVYTSSSFIQKAIFAISYSMFTRKSLPNDCSEVWRVGVVVTPEQNVGGLVDAYCSRRNDHCWGIWDTYIKTECYLLQYIPHGFLECAIKPAPYMPIVYILCYIIYKIKRINFCSNQITVYTHQPISTVFFLVIFSWSFSVIYPYKLFLENHIFDGLYGHLIANDTRKWCSSKLKKSLGDELPRVVLAPVQEVLQRSCPSLRYIPLEWLYDHSRANDSASCRLIDQRDPLYVFFFLFWLKRLQR